MRIIDLAYDLIRFSGLRPNQDIKVDVVGMRPGEKLHEELLTAEEGLTKTTYEKNLCRTTCEDRPPGTLQEH